MASDVGMTYMGQTVTGYAKHGPWCKALHTQSSGDVWKLRWTSWAPVPNKPSVSVDVKQHSTKRCILMGEGVESGHQALAIKYSPASVVWLIFLSLSLSPPPPLSLSLSFSNGDWSPAEIRFSCHSVRNTVGLKLLLSWTMALYSEEYLQLFCPQNKTNKQTKQTN